MARRTRTRRQQPKPKPTPPYHTPRDPLTQDMGAIALIRRSDGHAINLPDITSFWDMARTDPDQLGSNVADFRASAVWLGFCREHILALQITGLHDVETYLSCLDCRVPREECVRCAVLGSVVHLWMWDEPSCPIVNEVFVRDGQAMLRRLGQLGSLMTLAVPHAMLEAHLLSLWGVPNLQTVRAVRMAHAPGLAVRVSWSFEMPQRRADGHFHDWAEPLTTPPAAPCQDCHAVLPGIWATFKLKAGENFAAKLKRDLIEGKGGLERCINEATRAGHWVVHHAHMHPGTTIEKEHALFAPSARSEAEALPPPPQSQAIAVEGQHQAPAPYTHSEAMKMGVFDALPPPEAASRTDSPASSFEWHEGPVPPIGTWPGHDTPPLPSDREDGCPASTFTKRGRHTLNETLYALHSASGRPLASPDHLLRRSLGWSSVSEVDIDERGLASRERVARADA
ncbi:hypothetical protein CLAFUW4_08649 [Fulvia fulva]|uniref:Uncharacterized protein n=1 Tax=Passalora fulva TaxID=5499 RepID=A0A9Q8P703_PASFU|nr:uncharacterized protein CLAFUR5_08748 [Fulvia fulva]KAK4629672.1 hypothetical protein CLAFUR4_08651 [Fulvia fulva]KAK4630233.1 hypothetical protein CLAFUR0_08647 [Fulvia fulva]UJO15569.1 hypothetical protein CLAFUR5_08748 [Fulvia fulva]WPV12037.1 hypothetical protein CLAFUW4_08649 [Fulvia fulva]WPV26984.1 hypothetical protein CLAFUW7_08646 [Fulvia fulva]